MLASIHKWKSVWDQQNLWVVPYTTLRQFLHCGMPILHPSDISHNHNTQRLLTKSSQTLTSLPVRKSHHSRLLEFVGTLTRQVELYRRLHYHQHMFSS